MTATSDVSTTELPSSAQPPVPGAPDPALTSGQRIAAWLRTHRGLVALLVLPFVVFGIPELFGWVFLDGDNFLQNLPMRVLVGRDLQHWSLPLWNPYLFGGTPLLGGFNAGAAYPVTWLTAVLPTFTAWTFNLALAYDVALAGMYLFLRRQSISNTAALFGAASFAFAGYMSAQMVHIDLIEGAAWMPWTLVAVHGLTGGRENSAVPRAGSGPATRGWIVLFAVSVGLSLLTGSAEAIIDSSALMSIYAVGRLFTNGYFNKSNVRTLGITLLALITGGAGGLALGAVQWIPGLQFLSESQRSASASTYSFFSSGSLPVRLVALLISPFALGTNQAHLGPYVGPLNFQEVTGYVGVLALIGACSLFLKRFRTRPEARQWWVWYVIIGVGLLSAFGSQTPFGHLLYEIPIINDERLLNRNLLLVDFSLAVLLAWWIHLLIVERTERGGPGRDTASPERVTNRVPDRVTVRSRWRGGQRAEIAVTCVPLAIMVVLCVLLWAVGAELERLLGIRDGQTTAQRLSIAGVVTAGVLVAGAATWLVLVERRFPVRKLTRLLGTVLVVDLFLFNVFVTARPTTEARAQAIGPMSSSFRATVGDGRFIIYDPDEFQTSQLYELGQTDLNTYASFASGQGYTALTGSNYVDATGAHFQEDLNPATLDDGVWDDLNVSTLLSLPGYFLTPLGQHPHDSVEFPRNIDSYNSAPTPVATSYEISKGQSRTWYFGGMLTLHSATIPVLSGRSGKRGASGRAGRHPRAARSGHLQVGLVSATGAVDWLPGSAVSHQHSDGHASLHLVLAQPVSAGGIVVKERGPNPAILGVPTATTTEAGEVALNGRMQYGVTPFHWVFTGMLGSFAIFHNTRARGWSWVNAPGGGPAPSGSTSATPGPDETGDQQITVHATSAVLVGRSQTWATGWQVTVQPIGSGRSHPPTGQAETVPATQTGVVQGVVLPRAGNYLVTFDYRPNSVKLGLVVSGLTVVALILWAVLELEAGRKRRRRSGDGGPEETDPQGLIPG